MRNPHLPGFGRCSSRLRSEGDFSPRWHKEGEGPSRLQSSSSQLSLNSIPSLYHLFLSFIYTSCNSIAQRGRSSPPSHPHPPFKPTTTVNQTLYTILQSIYSVILDTRLLRIRSAYPTTKSISSQTNQTKNHQTIIMSPSAILVAAFATMALAMPLGIDPRRLDTMNVFLADIE